MKKILLLLFSLPFIIYFLTCDRADMYTIAKYGQKPELIYIFSDGLTDDGAFTTNGDPQQRCLDAIETTYSFLEITQVYPLLSTSSRDVKDVVPSIFHDVAVAAVDSTQATSQVSNSWPGLWDNTLDASLSSLGGFTSSSYWTGSTQSGEYDTTNCQDWTSNDGMVYMGYTGDPTANDGTWVYSTPHPCDMNYTLLCVGY